MAKKVNCLTCGKEVDKRGWEKHRKMHKKELDKMNSTSRMMIECTSKGHKAIQQIVN